MNKKTKGILAGVAGGALLLGAGGTFALWSDQATIPGGNITAGQLDVNAKELQWFDVSNDHGGHLGLGIDWDRIDFGPEAHWNGAATDFNTWSGDATGRDVYDINAWRIVPGDQLLGVSDLTVDLEGDNLRADLTVHAPAGTEDLGNALGLRYVLLDQGGNQVGEAAPLGQTMAQSLDAGEYRVLIVGDFSDEITGNLDDTHHSLMRQVAELQDISFELNQVR